MKNTTYQQRKRNKLCCYCGKQDEQTLQGRVFCKKCSTYRKYQTRMQKVLLKEQHKCLDCHQDLPTDWTKTLCPVCGEKQRKRHLKKQRLSIDRGD